MVLVCQYITFVNIHLQVLASDSGNNISEDQRVLADFM